LHQKKNLVIIRRKSLFGARGGGEEKFGGEGLGKVAFLVEKVLQGRELFLEGRQAKRGNLKTLGKWRNSFQGRGEGGSLQKRSCCQGGGHCGRRRELHNKRRGMGFGVKTGTAEERPTGRRTGGNQPTFSLTGRITGTNPNDRNMVDALWNHGGGGRMRGKTGK